MKLETGRVIGGRYEIIEMLGAGGMAVAYRSKDLKLERYVTLKIMREEFTADEEFIGRFTIEARAAASLSNPNIVNVYDVGQDGDVHYIVMEYIAGSTLKDLILKKAPFENENTLGVAIQIANGLMDAHQHNIVHRDIKPQNILVTGDGAVKVTDFGIARAANAGTLTGGPTTMGSVHYFSPEQARGGFVDHKSDIYSLGIVMYEMATGKLPFDGDTVVTVALKHINDPLPDMTALNPDISESLVRIIRKATEKSSAKRYASVEEMSNDLKRALTNASGDFLNDSPQDSPTVDLSRRDREEIRRANRRRLEYYDYDDNPKDSAEGYNDDYDNDDYNDDDYDDYGYDNKPDKKSDMKIILSAIGLAVVLISLITFAAWRIYDGQKPKPLRPPDLTGMTVEAAKQLADEQYGLKVLQVEEAYDELDEGLIVSQAETPEDIVYKGDTLHVTVSRGDNRVEIPRLEMRPAEEAREMLTALDLAAEEQPYEDETLPSGVVIRQEPAAGEKIEPGGTVLLHVSVGPDVSPVLMPSLLGLTEAEAIEILRDMELTPGLSTKIESTTYKSGTVCHQSIDPGEEIERGTEVGYTVSTGAPIPTPNPISTPKPTETESAPTDGLPESYNSNLEENVPPAVRTGTLEIHLWSGVPDGAETVHLRIIKVDGSGANTTVINDPNVSVTRFPLSLTIEGTGVAEYLIYSVDEFGNEVLQSRSTHDFGGGTE